MDDTLSRLALPCGVVNLRENLELWVRGLAGTACKEALKRKSSIFGRVSRREGGVT